MTVTGKRYQGLFILTDAAQQSGYVNILRNYNFNQGSHFCLLHNAQIGFHPTECFNTLGAKLTQRKCSISSPKSVSQDEYGPLSHQPLSQGGSELTGVLAPEAETGDTDVHTPLLCIVS